MTVCRSAHLDNDVGDGVRIVTHPIRVAPMPFEWSIPAELVNEQCRSAASRALVRHALGTLVRVGAEIDSTERALKSVDAFTGDEPGRAEAVDVPLELARRSVDVAAAELLRWLDTQTIALRSEDETGELFRAASAWADFGDA